MRTSRIPYATLSLAAALLSTSAAFAQVAEPAGAEPAEEQVPTAQPARAATAQPATAQPATAQAATAATSATQGEQAPVYEEEALVFGTAGQFSIGVDRLFGVSRDSETTTTPAPLNGYESKSTIRSTNFSLLGISQPGATRFNAPRLSADYFVIDGLSLGGSLGYFWASGHTKTSMGGVDAEADTGSESGYLVAARVGFAKMFNEMIGIWPRAALSYLHIGVKDPDGNDEPGGGYRAAVGLDVPLVLAPMPHFGFLLGPSLDYGFAGKNDVSSTDVNGNAILTGYDVSSYNIALNAGMFVYF